ncbi:MAG: ABC transporter substrate-binding protein [Candidatus Hydrothermarchaeales archaeon]
MTPSEIRIGHLSTVYHTSFILMGTGWIEKKMDLKPVWKLFAGGPGVVRAFDNDEVDIGYVGLPPAMIGMDKGVPIKCVAGGHVEGTVFIGRKGLKSLNELNGDMKATLQQFKGRSIGSPPNGSIHDVIIHDLIEKTGLTRDISVKNYDWADFIPDAMEEGELNATVGTPPLGVIVLQTIDSKMIIPPSELWPNNPSYGIIVKNELIEDSPDLIREFLRLHENASNLIRMHPEKAAKMVSNVVRAVDKDFVLQVYKVSPKYCASLPDEFVESTLRFVPVLNKLKYILRELTEDYIFDFRFIREIHSEPPHYEEGIDI